MSSHIGSIPGVVKRGSSGMEVIGIVQANGSNLIKLGQDGVLASENCSEEFLGTGLVIIW